MTGIPLLLEMLTYKRPARSLAESQFIRRFIVPTGAKPDAMGDYILRVGTSRVAWLSHLDTVHRNSGRQRLRVRAGTVTVRHPRRIPVAWQECLGADDTTGVWLMLEMIRARVRGLYVFHHAEEQGCVGSSYIANDTPELLDGIDYAISLDRRGRDSVVTHQIGFRTASDVFAWSLADALDLPDLAPDPTGIYTDSEVYAHLIPECTNLSVGYKGQHTAYECQNLGFARKLRNRLTRFDESRLLVERTPSYPRYYGRDDDDDDDDEWGIDDDTLALTAEVLCPLCDKPLPAREAWPFAGSEVCGECFEAVTA